MHISRDAGRCSLVLAAVAVIGCGMPATEPEAAGEQTRAHIAQAVSSSGVTRNHGPTMEFVTIRPIFWLPPGRHFEPGTPDPDAAYEQLMTQWVHDIDQTPYYDMITQYNGESNPRMLLGRAYVDQTPYPRAGTAGDPLRKADLEAEVSRTVAAIGGAEDLNHLYVVFTASDIVACSDDDCSSKPCGFHSHFKDDFVDTIYAWVGIMTNTCNSDPGRMAPNGSWVRDGSVDILSHEVFEAVSDPHLDAWASSDGKEIGDLCEDDVYRVPSNATSGADVYLNGHPYHVQQEWSQQAHACGMDSCSGGVCPPVLRVAETVDDETPVTGSSITYRIEVRNSSDTAVATHVVVSGTLPAGYTVTSVLPAAGAWFSGSAFRSTFADPIAVHDAGVVEVTAKAGSVVGRTDRACASVSFGDLLGAAQPAVASSPCAATTPTAANAIVRGAAGWDNVFQAYGDTSGKWNGGDGAQSTVLPDGATAWFFNDSYYGNVEPDGTRPLFGNSTPRNMVVIQRGAAMTDLAGPSNPYLNPLNLPGTTLP